MKSICKRKSQVEKTFSTVYKYLEKRFVCVEGNSSDILLYFEIRDLKKFLKKIYIVNDCFVDYREEVRLSESWTLIADGFFMFDRD